MRNKPILLVGGHVGTSLMTKMNEAFEDKGISVVNVEDAETVEDLRNTYIEPILIHNPYNDAALAMAQYGEEKKKKKPCTSHEYVLSGKEETHPNAYREIWKCRHCGRQL